ncbi:tetratricopeptide repeat protein [Oceanobacillus salinisoli]|uniref:tetratricopeptide repeat protein n=1 Tax=Oceanobacillus salinisoli TaxID=2678611 RepID=UPI001E3BF182|nr:GTP-binding protein [Oceanobacillus salinisoli]
MTSENQLIGKSYYKTFMEDDNKHPIEILGEKYIQEQRNEVFDLSFIRFAQGEVYFLNKDYEAAIFKWENVSNELKPWAQKNIADAHFKLDFLAIAEDYYKGIETDSDVLKIEVLLQLFHLYIRRDKTELAKDTIKRAVDLNPDYPDVTEQAKSFFEQEEDWDHAIDLATKEAVRTKSIPWFNVLKMYVEQRHIAKRIPGYFSEALMTLYSIDKKSYENLVTALWNSYKESNMYFSWLKEINQILLNNDSNHSYEWRELSGLYKETYDELINGKYLIWEISHLIPIHLTNWMNVATSSDKLLSSSAVLAWNEMFPSSINTTVVNMAENFTNHSSQSLQVMEEAARLFKSIMLWAEDKGVLLNDRFDGIVRELLDLDHYHLLIAGTNEKSAFINKLFDANLLVDSTKTGLLSNDVNNVYRSLSNLDDYSRSGKRATNMIHCRMPVSFSEDNKLSLIDPPEVMGENLADILLFVLNAASPLSEKELDMAVKFREKSPDISIHFLINKDSITNIEETMKEIENTTSRISMYFPDAKVFVFSVHDKSMEQFEALTAFLQSISSGYDLKTERTNKILLHTKKLIQFLLDKRVEMENNLLDTIEWKEEMATKLTGAVHQMSDLQEEKTQIIKNAYCLIKDEMRADLMVNIPKLLRNCSEMVSEDSNFEKIHVAINEEMNKRIKDYIEGTVLPDFRIAIQEWIAESDRVFQDSQAFLDECKF